MKRYNLSFFICKGYAKIINFTSFNEYVKESYIYSEKHTKTFINITFEDVLKECKKMQKRYYIINSDIYKNLFN
jgi:hypothetical protein